jgi:hypothetical protein
MVNPKLEKAKKSLSKIPKGQLGEEDLLSSDLADRIGSLAEKAKITIRLDESILKAAKTEAKDRGVSYQRLINDKLLAAFELSQKPKDSQPSLKELSDKINKLTKRLQKLEQIQLKKQA